MNLNIANRTIFCRDNLDVLRGLNSESVDLVYLDPPFNKKKVFTAPIGSQAEGAEFSDIFKRADVKDEWLDLIEFDYPDIYKLISAVKEISPSDYNWCYLSYMAIRLIECRRVLKSTGSLYLHCDPTMSHYLKALLDCIFDEKNFRNEIVWGYTGPGSPQMKQFNRKHDVIFWYSKGKRWTFNGDDVRMPYKDPNQRPRKAFDTGGSFTNENITKMRLRGEIPETHWTDIAIAVRSSKERVGYPTQKPLKLLERIIRASTNKGDIVLDPFCGCATTCVAAETLERQWIGIDVSPKAYELVKERLNNPVRMTNLQNGDSWQFEGEIIQRTDIPVRTDIAASKPIPYKTMRRKLYRDQGGKCNLCGVNFDEWNLEIDHIHPRSKGGIDNIENRQLLCGHCNRMKSNRSQAEAKAAINKFLKSR